MEARKVSSTLFTWAIGLLLSVIVLLFGWTQWALSQQNARVAAAEAKADTAVSATVNLNQSLSVQITSVQVDLQWIKLKLNDLDTQGRRR